EIERKSPRWALPGDTVISVSSEQGQGRLVNFSDHGLGMRFNRYLGKGVTLQLSLSPPNPEIAKRLRDEGLAALVCEVRWGRIDEGGEAILGLLILNLSDSQRERLVAFLREQIAGAQRPAA